MKLLWLSLLDIISRVVTETIQPSNYALIKIMRKFQMSNPSIVHSSLSKREQTHLIKSFSNYGEKIIFNPAKSNLHDSMIIYTDLANYKWNRYPETHVPTLGKIQVQLDSDEF